MIKCDFCSGRLVVAAYPCRDFTIPEYPKIGSRGPWAACAECARLINTDQREALAWRAWRLLANRSALCDLGIPEDEGLARMRALHDLFFAHRDGDPVPVGLN
jgi:hypothetical protein